MNATFNPDLILFSKVANASPNVGLAQGVPVLQAAAKTVKLPHLIPTQPYSPLGANALAQAEAEPARGSYRRGIEAARRSGSLPFE